MENTDIKKLALKILAKYGVEATVEEVEEYIDDPNAVLKLSYCLEAIEAALSNNDKYIEFIKDCVGKTEFDVIEKEWIKRNK